MAAWNGGKHRIAKTIAFVMDQIPHHEYVDLFCGMLSTFFSKRPARHSTLNDLSWVPRVIYETVRDHPMRLAERLYMTPSSSSLFVEWTNSWPWENENREERAFRAVYCIQNALMKIGPWTGHRRTKLCIDTRDGGVKRVQTPSYAHLHDIMKMQRHLQQRVKFLEEDFADVVKKMDNLDTLFYADPPYMGTSVAEGYARNDYTDERFIETMRDIRGHAIVSHGESLASMLDEIGWVRIFERSTINVRLRSTPEYLTANPRAARYLGLNCEAKTGFKKWMR